MSFVKARMQEQFTDHQKEIMNVCRYLYLEGGYDNVDFKQIAKITSFTRLTINTYYKTKDEILLDVLKLELIRLNEELMEATKEPKHLSNKKFASFLTTLLTQNDLLMSLISILYTFLENNSSLEKVTEFKDVILKSSAILEQILQCYYPDSSKHQRNTFINAIFSYIMGLYPMCHLSEKQMEAIKRTGIAFEQPNFQFMCEHGIYRLLEELSA